MDITLLVRHIAYCGVFNDIYIVLLMATILVLVVIWAIKAKADAVRKILFGIFVGIILACSLSFLYRTYWLKDYIVTPSNIKIDTDKETLNQSVYELKIQNIRYAEKIDAVNKRLDDFLLFGGLIITLILAITVSVYLKTETEVDKHMKAHAKEIEEEINSKKIVINEYVEEAAKLLQGIQTDAGVAKALRSNMETGSKPS